MAMNFLSNEKITILPIQKGNTMMKTVFENVAKELQCTYECKDDKYTGFNRSLATVSTHQLSIEYKDCIIDVQYEFGKTNLAEIKTTIKSDQRLFGFSVRSGNHFVRLFTKKGEMLKVKTENKGLKVEILKLLKDNNLEKMANDTAFEPEIDSKFLDGHYIIDTKFYLGFDNKEDSIIPIVNFYKGMIDYLKF